MMNRQKIGHSVIPVKTGIWYSRELHNSLLKLYNIFCRFLRKTGFFRKNPVFLKTSYPKIYGALLIRLICPIT